MKIRFLFDENMNPRVREALLHYRSEIDALRVGDQGAPPDGTLDPAILRYSEATQRLLVTDNRRSMPEHIANHYSAGGHHWGVAWTRPNTKIGKLAETLYLIWEIEEAEDWIDRIDWIPY